jgi:uncharacterized membrane protein YeaQ/YmgE (transglycosylase-associated protein family)
MPKWPVPDHQHINVPTTLEQWGGRTQPSLSARTLHMAAIESFNLVEVNMHLIGSLIAWAVFGLVIGAIARLLYPGRQSMGLMMTMFLGIIGSFVGGFISWMLGDRPELGAFQSSGWIASILGALIVVWVSLYLSSRSGRNVDSRPL